MTNNDLTLIAALLDRSGSMSTSKRATEDGWHKLIDEQRRQPGRCLITLCQFDTEYDVVYVAQDVHDIPALDLEPRGGTALLDGMARMIRDVGCDLAALPADKRPGTVICLIMTDGMENSSRHATWTGVHDMVKHQTDCYNWKFVFIGSNMDAIAVGGRLGVDRHSTIAYDDKSYLGTVSVADAASSYITATRGGVNAAFTEADRTSAMGK